MVNDLAIEVGEYVGKQLIEASKTKNTQKRERFLYPALMRLKRVGDEIKRIPDGLERSLTMRDINLGLNFAIASSKEKYEESGVRGLYQKFLHKLGLWEKA